MRASVSTSGPTDIVDVTETVVDLLPASLGTDTCTVFVPHTTAGVVVNESEPGLLEDFEAILSSLVPDDGDYRHDQIDGNAAGHLRASLLGESVTVPVADGTLAFGTWQSIPSWKATVLRAAG